jgi:uncharacterized protein (TIGR02444 family)
MSPARGFWTFSVTIYGAPDVEAACIGLQDRFGADVNMALYCLWMGDALTGETLDAAIEAAEPMRTYIEPLRQMRRGLPRDAEDGLRAAVKKAELAAEKLEQDALDALAGPGRRSVETARDSLRLYAARLGVDVETFLEAAKPLIGSIDSMSKPSSRPSA